MIKQSRIFEVFEADEKGRRKLYTKNLVPGKNIYGEQLVQQNETEFREWNASKSKLASTILKGSPNIGIRKNDFVLYLGSASGTTVSHVSDIVGDQGFVFAVDVAPRVMRDLIFLCHERKNVAPILGDAFNVDSIRERISAVDVIYQDVAQKNQTEIFLRNVLAFLKEEGYALLAVKARSIDVTKQPSKIFSQIKSELEKNLVIIDIRTLEPFQKDHCMFICKKRKE